MLLDSTNSPPSAGLTTLCLGLDIAWFGGSKADPASRHDCLAWTIDVPGTAPTFGLRRIPLPDRDPTAAILLEFVTEIVNDFPADRVVFAIDAPLQEAAHRDLPPRSPLPGKGEVARRKGEDAFSRDRQRLDALRGGSEGWHPNLQPGAPVAPRVKALIAGLETLDFRPWTPQYAHHPRLALECFPAATIWAGRVAGLYPPSSSAAEIKAYKATRRRILTDPEVEDLVRRVASPLGPLAGDDEAWPGIVDQAISWMLSDPTWPRKGDHHTGGKMLDDVVDTLLCLLVARAHAAGQSHLWHDHEVPDDGHICGAGTLERLEGWALGLIRDVATGTRTP